MPRSVPEKRESGKQGARPPPRQGQLATCSSSESMPKAVPGKRKSGKQGARSPGSNEVKDAQGRLNAMVGLVKAVEGKTYHNKTAAVKAKNLMNAVGVILQELPGLLETLDANKDGFNYKLFDIGMYSEDEYKGRRGGGRSTLNCHSHSNK